MLFAHDVSERDAHLVPFHQQCALVPTHAVSTAENVPGLK